MVSEARPIGPKLAPKITIAFRIGSRARASTPPGGRRKCVHGASQFAELTSLHRMVSYQAGNGSQVARVYNLRNLPVTITYPGFLNVTEGYDNAGRWSSVKDWNSNSTGFGYDADSNLTTETLPFASGFVDSFSFNAADQMTTAGVDPVRWTLRLALRRTS